MKKQINSSFLKQLIDLDFPIVKLSTRGIKANNTTNSFNLNTKNEFHILDLFKLNNSLKQFIRILFSLKYYKKYDNSEFVIYIWCANKFIRELIEIFAIGQGISEYIVISDLFPEVDVIENLDKQKLLFVLGDPWTEKPEQMIRTRVLYNKIFFVSKLSFQKDRPQYGAYKIQNNLSDYKKLLVLLIIIDKVIIGKKSSQINIEKI